jgi:hypothetical protein
MMFKRGRGVVLTLREVRTGKGEDAYDGDFSSTTVM